MPITLKQDNTSFYDKSQGKYAQKYRYIFIFVYLNKIQFCFLCRFIVNFLSFFRYRNKQKSIDLSPQKISLTIIIVKMLYKFVNYINNIWNKCLKCVDLVNAVIYN